MPRRSVSRARMAVFMSSLIWSLRLIVHPVQLRKFANPADARRVPLKQKPAWERLLKRDFSGPFETAAARRRGDDFAAITRF